MVFIALLLLQWLALAHAKTFNVGVLVNDVNLKQVADTVVADINKDPETYSMKSGDVINVTSIELPSNAIQATTDICDNLIVTDVYAVVSTNAVNGSEAPYIASYACAFYKIPVVFVESRETVLSDKELHSTLLRTVPPYSEQAEVWANLVRSFKWSKVNLVCSNDYDHRLMFIKFTALAYQSSITIEKPILFPADEKNLTSHLEPLQDTQSKVIIFGASWSDAVNVYKHAKELGLDQEKYIWIVDEQALQGDALKQSPQGVVGVQLNKSRSLSDHISDAIKVVAHGIGRMDKKGQLHAAPPSSCDEPPGEWETGDNLYRSLVNVSIDGRTGPVKFNWYGDRLSSKYDVINVGFDSTTKSVGSIQDEEVDVRMGDIVWPGNQTEIPDGIFVSNHLQIVTVESRPFVSTERVPESGKCSDLESKRKNKKHEYIRCTGPSQYGDKSVQEHCCYGFCIDLLVKLANKVNFTYDLKLVEDGKFGSLKRVNGSNMKRWNGMVGDIVEGKADLIVASLTINNERAQYIEFSKPFKYQGITILVRKSDTKSSLDSFLRPFKAELWLLVLLSVHVVAVILYLLDRFSPFGRYKMAQTGKDETALNLSSAMWFSWGVLLNSGIGEGTPRSFSARVLGMVWAGFAMIIVASYTANLAAFLVLDRPKPVVTGIDDPSLRNPNDGFRYATISNSSVDAYFRRQVELSSMYTFMEKYNVHSEQVGIDAVKSGDLKAFIWDSPVLFHETSQDCDLTTVGDLFGRSGYGIGMPKGSPWSNEISLAVLHFHESGTMEDLESTWIDFGNCESDSNSPTTLGLQHMLGVFIMVAAGIGAGIVIVILEVLYYKHKGWRKHQKKVVKKATESWQDHVHDKKMERGECSKPNFKQDESSKESVYGSKASMNGSSFANGDGETQMNGFVRSGIRNPAYITRDEDDRSQANNNNI